MGDKLFCYNSEKIREARSTEKKKEKVRERLHDEGRKKLFLGCAKGRGESPQISRSQKRKDLKSEKSHLWVQGREEHHL